MAELVVNSAVQYVGTLINMGSINSDLFDVVSEAKAVLLELDSLKTLLFQCQAMQKMLKYEMFDYWLAEVTRMAYNFEDVVDTYVSETESSNIFSRAARRLYWYHHTLVELRRLFYEMKTTKALLEEYSKKCEEIIVSEFRKGSKSFEGYRQASDDYVVGIENDVEKMVDMLTSTVVGKGIKKDDHVNVLCIFGMGGIGKTTLARNIYNHGKIQKHFKHRAWVNVYKGWGRDTGEVVFEISRQSHNNKALPVEIVSEYNVLVQNLLSLNKGLIVLDDVWDLEALQTDLILKLIELDDRDDHQDLEITIVTTSRHCFEPSKNDKVKWDFHEVQFLSPEKGLILFKNVSRGDDGKELATECKGLAMEMLWKCEGLPLAIVALGKLLKTKDTIEEWEKVFSQLVSKEGPKDIYLPVNEILALSYHHLPYNLKPCFLYFGLFPEEFPIKAATLIKMWIAEGFVPQDGESATEIDNLEKEARNFLNKLIDHTMVQVVKRTYNGKAKIVRVLSMIRDLCIMEAQEIDFLSVYSSNSDQKTQKHSRRAAVNLSKTSRLPLDNPHLRTLCLHEHEVDHKRADISRSKTSDRKLNQQTVLDLAIIFEKLKLLRVLDLNGIRTTDGVMPKEIRDLIHLRYLRIRSTNICELPKSIGKLRKLETLDYWNVYADKNGIRLPNVFWKLTNLRYLFLPYEMSSITKEDFRLHTIKDLQILWGVRGGNWMLKEMPKLSANLRRMCIQGISRSEQIDSILKSPVMRVHSNLYSLVLEWYSFSLDSHKLKALCSKNSLTKLRLRGNASDDLNPIQFTANLQKLELYYTQLKKSESMKALGELPRLEFLRLAKDSFVGSEWTVEEHEFPKLKKLKLSKLTNLKKLTIERDAMTSLMKLSIVSCTSLEQVQELRSPVKLKIDRMSSEFKKKSLKRLEENNTNCVTSNFFRNPHQICICVFLCVVWIVNLYFVYKLGLV